MPRGIPNHPKPDVQPEPEPEAVLPARGESKALTIIDIEEAELQTEGEVTPEAQPPGTRFYFGEIGVFHFGDGTSYHVRDRRDNVTDPQLAANLIAYGQANPSCKITLES